MYTIVGSEAYFKNLPTHGIKFLCIIALIKDPTNSCNWILSKTEYPVPSATKLELLVVKDIVSLWGMPEDKQQDADDSPQQAVPSNQAMQNQNQEE
jgi:hypothetical protein